MRRLTRRTHRAVPRLQWLVLGWPLLGCAETPGGSPGPDGPRGSPSVASAYSALTEGRLESLPQLIDDLDEAIERDPEDGVAVFYAGAMRLWKLGEDAQGLSIAQMAPFALPMIDHFQKAQTLLPDDPRIPSFLGLARVRVGLSLNSPELIDAGLADLDDGIARLPAFGHFLRASATDGAASDSAYYAGVVDDMHAMAEHCGFARDAQGKYAYPDGPLSGGRYVCNNAGIVPHVWEGLFITFGDVVLKAGGPTTEARALYESARAAPSFEGWPFADALRGRIETLEERAALYADSDPANDPPVWTDDGHVCVGCHQKRP
jgi:hypothetical protein